MICLLLLWKRQENALNIPNILYLTLSFEKFSSAHRNFVGLLFNVIMIMKRNIILKFYNNLQDHHTQANKQIIAKRVLDNYPCSRGISKTLIPSFSKSRMSSLWDPSTVDSIPLDLLCYSHSQEAIGVWVPWSKLELSSNRWTVWVWVFLSILELF